MIRSAIKKDSSCPEPMTPVRVYSKVNIFKKFPESPRSPQAESPTFMSSPVSKYRRKLTSRFAKAAFKMINMTLEFLEPKEDAAQKASDKRAKKAMILKIMNYVNEITKNEIDRITNLYLVKREFTTENVLNLYKTFLVLLGNREANRCILDFLKKKNVNLFQKFFC